jgi:hypothetical protein
MLRSLIGNPSLRLVSRSRATISQSRRQIHYSVAQEVRMRPRITPGHGLLQVEARRMVLGAAISGSSFFHSTPRRQGAPLVPFLVGALKVGISCFSPLRTVLSDSQ